MGVVFLQMLSKFPSLKFVENSLITILAGQMDGEGLLMVRSRWGGPLLGGC